MSRTRGLPSGDLDRLLQLKTQRDFCSERYVAISGESRATCVIAALTQLVDHADFTIRMYHPLNINAPLR